MSGEADLPQGDDGLAAEYVLGTLPGAERAATAARARSDARLAGRIVDWEARLAPLNDGFAPVRAPRAVWGRIEAQVFGAPAPRRGAGRWSLLAGLGLGAGLAAAVVLTVLPVLRPLPGPVIAELVAEGGELRLAARFEPRFGVIHVTRTAGPAAPAGQDYQFWVVPEGGVPVPLGLLREGELAAATAVAPGTVLAVSLEPAGGSPTGLPTGPVLATATITGS
ncbi:MAG: anti-sigma factor [Defluviimonas sp.]|nr:anti-sigma factor [Defluviimonas sp.]